MNEVIWTRFRATSMTLPRKHFLLHDDAMRCATWMLIVVEKNWLDVRPIVMKI